ncbi:GAF domain-containing protein [Kitasatospora purpeofusca]|uniref:GAF domain-containing protein n=1 Tax=Kitasatospora purpeofusca TaxID=67352 RepID=UPI00224F6BDF|nr:GAF domain-containing protein [Kitasatospora purpeofusca]MCX4759097.1 GAF domain-containing protein [Kitasatospora purpeofusca]WSR30490.1 GAF domain-containing protein [Kitasatospora purpeofusca]WSR38729.1 GAF domain-containing protein [Kitasatospora purpeofusca]
MSTDPLESAELRQRRLLQSIVEVARSVFGAAAASVLLVDEADGDLVFEAVAGEGEHHLLGSRFPAGTGIAGWALMTGQPVVVDDVADSPQFARSAAESTGYVPSSIMAAPLICDGDCIGVLSVLDRDSRPRCDLGDMASLGLLATEMATVLELLLTLRAADPAPAPATAPGPGKAAAFDLAVLRRVADRLPGAPDHVAATVGKLLAMADDLLATADADA